MAVFSDICSLDESFARGSIKCDAYRMPYIRAWLDPFKKIYSESIKLALAVKNARKNN